MEEYSGYKYQVFAVRKGYMYEIEKDIGSTDWFETEQEARFAAIGHIDKLEKELEQCSTKELIKELRVLQDRIRVLEIYVEKTQGYL